MRFIKEQDWDGDQYDWHESAPKGPFDGLVVPAGKLVSAPAADIVAVWLDAHRKPIYLVSMDDEQYYHLDFDEILEQHFPAQEFLRWRNSWEYPDMPFTATEPFPERWRYMWCYPHTCMNFILIRNDLWEAYEAVVTEHTYKYSYDVSCDFPFLVDEALERLEHIKP